jgi:hypothetical protein
MSSEHYYERITIRLKSIFLFFGMDRPVVFGLLTKTWALSAGLITALLIATKFTPEIQGYYFTFASILTLQAFVELGLGAVIVQFCGHEWGKLSLNERGNIVGNSEALSRLRSIARIALKWFLLSAILITITLAIGGSIFFFSSDHNPYINWSLPWLLLCIITGLNICIIPIWSLIEGCNQVGSLYTYRFYQGVVSSITVWISISVGAELWTGALSGLSVFIFSVFFLRRKYYYFIISVFSNPGESLITWKKDILPMQWRMALASISTFFVYSLFVPIIFKYHGPVVAGQMGLTVSIILAIGNISFSWFSPKIPQFCILISQKKFKDLDVLFFLNTKITLLVLIITSAIFVLTLFVLNNANILLIKRLIDPLPALIFMIAYLIGFASAPFSHYMRAHKKEPIVFVVFIGSLVTGMATYVSGKYYSLDIMAISYLIINSCMTFSIIGIWHFFRLRWHS